jgi:hypothetical protein
MFELSEIFSKGWLSIGLLYLGPESIMPLASILAAVVGFLLLFWRVIVNFVKKIFGKGQKAPSEDAELVDPDQPNEPDEIHPK